jgi:hypothetical protein
MNQVQAAFSAHAKTAYVSGIVWNLRFYKYDVEHFSSFVFAGRGEAVDGLNAALLKLAVYRQIYFKRC